MKRFLTSACLASFLTVCFVACGDSSSSDIAGGVTDIGNSIAYTGAVVDASGKPVVAARVVAYYDSWDRLSIRDSVETKTDEKGKFELVLDSGASVIVLASDGELYGQINEINLSRDTLGSDDNPIVIGETFALSGHFDEMQKGYMRIVGSDEKAELDADGYFIFYRVPRGDVSLVFVDESKKDEAEPVARIDFTAFDVDDMVVLPPLKNPEGEWILLSDSRFYHGTVFKGILVSIPENVDVPQSASVEYKLRLWNASQVDSGTVQAADLNGLVVPIRFNAEDFENENLTIRSSRGVDFSYEVESWGSEALVWLRLDSLTAADSVLQLTLYNEGGSVGFAFREEDGVLAVLHMNGDAVVYGSDSVKATSVKDSLGIFGKGITLKPGQFIDLDHLDPCAGDFTLSLWTKWFGPNGEHQILFSERAYWSDSTSRFQWHFEANMQWFTVMKSMPNYPYTLYYGDANVVPHGEDAEWSYLTLVSKDRKVAMYVNGEMLSWVDDDGSVIDIQKFEPNNLNEEVPFRVGGNEIETETWNGAIDEVRIENVARSAAWIKASYEIQKAAIQLQ